MGFFRNQLANVVEWEEFRDDMVFYKWNNREIKKGSRLIIGRDRMPSFYITGRLKGFSVMTAIMISNQKSFRFYLH